MNYLDVGDCVFYVEHGPNDTGTVIAVSRIAADPRVLYTVQWDNDDETDLYQSSQLEFVDRDTSDE